MAVTFYTNGMNYAGFSKTAEPSITVHTYTCSGGETTGPAYDLVDNRRTNLITVDAGSESDLFNVDFDLAASFSLANFAIMDNHNLKTADATLLIEAGGAGTDVPLDNGYTGVLGTALTDTTMTGNIVDIGDDGLDGIFLGLFTTPTTSQYWDFVMDDFGSDDFDVDITMGEAFVGKSITTSTGPELKQTERYQYNGSNVIETDGGQKFGFSRHTTVQRRWQMKWIHLTDTDKTNLEYAFDVTKGRKHPFYIDFGLDATPKLFLVRFINDNLPFVKVAEGSHGLTIAVEEEV